MLVVSVGFSQSLRHQRLVPRLPKRREGQRGSKISATLPPFSGFYTGMNIANNWIISRQAMILQSVKYSGCMNAFGMGKSSIRSTVLQEIGCVRIKVAVLRSVAVMRRRKSRQLHCQLKGLSIALELRILSGIVLQLHSQEVVAPLVQFVDGKRPSENQMK